MGSKPDLIPRTMHPNSIAAIEPHQWQAGQSGNVNGRKTLGAALKTCLNAMEGMTIAEVQAIAKDKQRSVTWRAAAKRVLGMMRDGFHNHIPLAGSDFDRCSDRTDGKPHQSMHITRAETRPPAAIGMDLAALWAKQMTADPAMLGTAMANMAPDARAKAIAMLPLAEVDGAGKATE